MRLRDKASIFAVTVAIVVIGIVCAAVAILVVNNDRLDENKQKFDMMQNGKEVQYGDD